MYGRGKLEVKELIDGNGFGFSKDEASKVMDAMERRIARLTAIVEGWKRNSVELGEIYKKRLAMEQARTNELEEALSNAVTGGKIALEQAKILEKKLEDVQNTMATKNVDLGIENHKLRERNEELEERIKELEATISKMETTTPKWISVEDRLPGEKEQYKLLWVAHVSTDNIIKYMYEASFDYETKQFYTENDWGDKTFVSPAIWMVVPPPPTNEST